MEDFERVRNVVFYGRVSTEHEAQVSALSAQMQWYEDQLKYHPNWTLVDRYIDEGITGTKAKKRPAFLRMIEDSKLHKFDLIITREVCRFARNTVEALQYTRELKDEGIEVYFVSDNIRTMDGDGELRLSLMATLAQDESRKVSERSRAGQYISRQNGVLYGTGNILGYERDDDHYIINEEQAETVRMIFSLYLQGMGGQRIRDELVKSGRKRSCGDTEWEQNAILRIIKNCAYMGAIGYNKSYKKDFLADKRVINHDPSQHEIIFTDKIPAIVSPEVWYQAQEVRLSRQSADGSGKRVPQDVWTQRLECKCGSHFRLAHWHKPLKDGSESLGYNCYRRINKGKSACDMKGIPKWKLDLMAKEVIRIVWTEKKEVIMTAYEDAIRIASEIKSRNEDQEEVKNQIEKLKKRMSGLIEMKADGEITKDEFLTKKKETEEKIKELEEQLEEPTFDPEKIRKTLDTIIDFSCDVLPDEVIRAFVKKVKVIDNTHFIWYIGTDDDERIFNSEITGRKTNKTVVITANEDFSDVMQNNNTDSCSNHYSSAETTDSLNPEVPVSSDDRANQCNVTDCFSLPYSSAGGYSVWNSNEKLIYFHDHAVAINLGQVVIDEMMAGTYKRYVKRFQSLHLKVFFLL